VIPCQIDAIDPSQLHCHNVEALLYVSYHNKLFKLSCTISTRSCPRYDSSVRVYL